MGGLLVVIAGVYGAITKRLFERQDELFRTKSNKESVDKRFETVLARLDKHMDTCDENNKRFDEKLDRINHTLAHTNTSIAVMASKLGSGPSPTVPSPEESK